MIQLLVKPNPYPVRGGLMKLELTFDRAVFIAPKVYGGTYSEGEIVKVKGFKNPIAVSTLETVLTKGHKLELSHEKWTRDLSAGTIKVFSNTLYTLMATESNPYGWQLIFDNGIIVGTKPYQISEDKVIIKNEIIFNYLFTNHLLLTRLMFNLLNLIFICSEDKTWLMICK